MARRKHKHHHRRDVPYVANPVHRRDDFERVVDREPIRLRFSPLIRSRPALEVEDHRRHQPDDLVVPRLRSSRRAHVHVPKGKRPLAPLASGRLSKTLRDIRRAQDLQPRFKDPKFVNVCVRRKQRREVLLAKGRGGGGHRPPRRNQFSDIRC